MRQRKQLDKKEQAARESIVKQYTRATSKALKASSGKVNELAPGLFFARNVHGAALKQPKLDPTRKQRLRHDPPPDSDNGDAFEKWWRRNNAGGNGLF